jgi:hypothetical protein
VGIGLKAPGNAGTTVLQCEQAGPAILVHAGGDGLAGAGEFAAGLAPEPGHTVVVADVAPDTRPKSWEPVADELAGLPGVLRLVPARPAQTSTLAFGRWLADRLGRTVLAHEGAARQVYGGALFIPEGAGWLRFEPGRPPLPHSRRFPTPPWEDPAFAQARTLGPDTVVEPLPAGAWIRPAGPSAPAEAYRDWLVTRLVCTPDQPRLVIGHPGATPVPLSRIGQFRSLIPAGLRADVRFTRFGPDEEPDGCFGQALADHVQGPVVVGTGVQLLVPADRGGTEIRTLLPAGAMRWTPFVSDLGYLPRRSPGRAPADPRPIGHRPPVHGLTEVSPGVYEYGPDAVLEVTQSGLWMRPAKEPRGSGRIRAVPTEPEHGKLFFDSAPAVAGRMRELAADLLQRLEARVRGVFQILPASSAMLTHGTVAARGARQSTEGAAAGALAIPAAPAPSTPAQAGDCAPGGLTIPAAVEAPARPQPQAPAEAGDAPATEPAADVVRPPAARAPGSAAVEGPAPGPAATPGTAAPDPMSERPETGARADAPAVRARPRIRLESGPQPEVRQSGFAVRRPPEALHGSEAAAAAGSDPAQSPSPAGGCVTCAAAPAPAAALVPGMSPPWGPSSMSRATVNANPGAAGASTPGSPASSQGAREPAAGPARPEPPPPGALSVPPATAAPVTSTASAAPLPPPAPDGPQVQPVPSPEASAVAPVRGLERERAWLRRSLSRQYDDTANFISRILSEVPGLRATAASTPAELHSDLVAVRIYLAGRTRGLDDAVRTASAGPHVPLARCVASGLRRLPSYRGAARLRTELTAAELRWYEGREVVTEWSFTPALTTGRLRLPGSVEVLIWSIAARRTGLIDPVLPEQVVFLPCTRFTVLRVEDGERKRVFLRELAAAEVGADGRLAAPPRSMDVIAAEGLERAARAWQDEESAAVQEPDARATGHGDRFGSPPGLIARAAARGDTRPAGTAGLADPGPGTGRSPLRPAGAPPPSAGHPRPPGRPLPIQEGAVS